MRAHMRPLQFVDRFLNHITMYTLTAYALAVLAAVAIIFGFLGVLPFSGIELSSTLVFILAVCHISNIGLARVFGAVRNSESAYITAFILFFIALPISDVRGLVSVGILSVSAMALKYIVVYKARHIFNPAALALVLIGFTPLALGIWWVGSIYVLPFTLITAFLIVRKIRRADVFFACLASATVTASAYALFMDISVLEYVKQLYVSWPLIFFASVMLTEPFTLPPERKQRIVYGALIGALSSWPFSVGVVYGTPELALIVGNIYSYFVSLNRRLLLTLVSKTPIAKDTYEFTWKPNEGMFNFKPGQYLEWTVPHREMREDSRGNRRYFTIASSPTEDVLKMAIRFAGGGAHSSSYKRELLSLEPGGQIVAGQLSGDFVLPRDTSKKLIFIAGGIGITPFISMIKYMLDTGKHREIILFYSNKTPEDCAYKDMLNNAMMHMPLKVVYLLTDVASLPGEGTFERGFLTWELFTRHAPDYAQSVIYLSGPNAMVDAYKTVLRAHGVSTSRIVTDYFPGFA